MPVGEASEIYSNIPLAHVFQVSAHSATRRKEVATVTLIKAIIETMEYSTKIQINKTEKWEMYIVT